MVIHVRIKSNQDKLSMVRWPVALACKPEKGETIQSICGKYRARVMEICHIPGVDFTSCGQGISVDPYLEIDVAQNIN